MSAVFEVLRPGMLTTVQDGGRWGWQSRGIPVAGPMDWYAHRLANRRAGNPDGAAALEVTIAGPVLRARGAVRCAVAGAAFVMEIDGRPIDASARFEVPDGGTLRFGPRTAGARAALAVYGGIAVPEVLGSRATSTAARMGPFGGRALRAGDELPIGTAASGARPAGSPMLLPSGGATLRLLPASDAETLGAEAMDRLLTSRFVVSPRSDRMGYRLEGSRIPVASAIEGLSAGTPMGTVQVPPGGEPILLMADRQTTGGYPRIGTVITADLPLAGQLAPGDGIAFAACSRSEAIEALRAREAALGGGA